jgi:hypothetical protein
MTTTANRERVQEAFRGHVLAALDAAARETFNPPRNDAGASDADLPRLFKALDEQIAALCERYDVVLVDYEVAS